MTKRRRGRMVAVACGFAGLAVVVGASGSSGAVFTCDGEPVTVNIGNGDSPTPGDDVIRGTDAGETINSGGGHDIVCARGGNDTVNSGPGPDRVLAAAGADEVNLGIGNDSANGGDGPDVVRGQAGMDFLQGGRGRDRAVGGDGVDNCFAEVIVSCEGD